MTDAATMPRFADRREAGRRLVELLEDMRHENPIVLGIPRGGVVVAHETASALGASLEVLVVRKLGYPGHEEAGFGAIGEDGVLVPDGLAELEPQDPSYEMVNKVVEAKRPEVAELVERYRGGRERIPLAGATAVVIDDGIATGYTFAAALAIARLQGPDRLIAAVPVTSYEGGTLVSGYCDELRTVGTADPGSFFAVSLYYDHFRQVTDEEVVELLTERAGSGPPAET